MKNESRPARQIEDLQRLFRERLELHFARQYAQALEAGIITEAEAKEECQRYYDKYKSGLQSVYSHYTEQWDCFYSLQGTPDTEFRTRLSAIAHELARVYGNYALNAGYYLEELNRLPVGTGAWTRLRGMFLDRWCEALSDREYNYQLQHINRLCADFARTLAASTGTFSRARDGSEAMDARIAWVKRHLEPKMKRKITELALTMKRNPIVRELAEVLGRRHSLPERKYKAASSRNELNRIRRASHTDIQGVTTGDDLGHLLPLEYGMLATPRLEGIFLKKYAGKQLQMFDSRSFCKSRVRNTGETGGDLSAPEERGPVVVCVDTSGSMAGTYEQVAKAIVLCLALLSERERRPCQVLLFSSEVHTIEFRTLAQAFDKLAGFFCNTFHGGTDFGPVVAEAVRMLHRSEYGEADLLLLSDFDAESLSAPLHLQLEDIKERGAEVYSVAFGHQVNPFYTDVADRSWHYQ